MFDLFAQYNVPVTSEQYRVPARRHSACACLCVCASIFDSIEDDG